MYGKVNLKEYYVLLTTWDYWYMMSNSSEVYDKGAEQSQKIRQLAGQSAEHKALLDAWEKYMRGEGEKPSEPS